jgi:glycosyltransferase involved in cell wall biosynthesis
MAKFAVLSDTRLPTARNYFGHGLGQIMLAIAEGLLAKGHEVQLFAGRGSEFAGVLYTRDEERDFLHVDFSGFDAVLDGGHFHELSKLHPDAPIINLSHDREAPPGKNAVFPSAAHRHYHGYTEQNGKVVYNGVSIPHPPALCAPSPSNGEGEKDPYFAYLSTFYPPKGATMAMEAARLAGVKLRMAGTTPPAPPPGSNYIGPLWGEDKLNFLAGAKALLFPSGIEAGPITPLEAQSVGCPVIVSWYGGAKENMEDGVTGYCCRDTVGMAEAIRTIDQINRTKCREWVSENRSASRMVDEYEKLLGDVAKGAQW